MVNLIVVTLIMEFFRMKRFLSLLLASITVLSVNAMEKAPQASAFSFGATPASQPARPAFGSAAPAAQSAVSSRFGAQAAVQAPFGASTPAAQPFGQPAAFGGFGSQLAPAARSFGVPAQPALAAQPAASAFGAAPAQPAAAQPRPFMGFGAQAQTPSVRNLEFSNQSDNLVAIWVFTQQPPTVAGSSPMSFGASSSAFGGSHTWHPLILAPSQDSNNVIMGPGKPVHIYTSAGFYLLTNQNNILELTKELPSFAGEKYSEVIKTMPYNEPIAVLVIISPDGKVNFVKHE